MPLPEGRSKDDYELVELKGKHGLINLMVPKWEATQEEIDNVYRTVADVMINVRKEEQRKKK